jgi:hypothetical protein
MRSAVVVRRSAFQVVASSYSERRSIFRWSLASGMVAVGMGLVVATDVRAQDVDTARAAGAAFLIRAQQGDGSWKNAGGLEIQATASALEALDRAGLRNSPFFAAGAAWLANTEPGSIDSEARRIVTLNLAGRAVSVDAQTLAGKRNGPNGYSFGTYPGHGTTLIDTALALNALRVGLSGFTTDGSLVANSLCPILRAQRANGSWPYVPPTGTAQDARIGTGLVPTSLVMQELRAFSALYGGFSCGGISYTLNTVVANAGTWLTSQQNADGGFGERNNQGSLGASSVLASAIVLRALNGLSVPPAAAVANARIYLVGQRNAGNGSWQNDAFVTAQVVAALPAATGAQLTDTDRDGIPNVVETPLGTNPNVADSRGQIPTAGLSQAALTTAAFLAAGTRGVPFTFDIPAAGTPPFAFALVTGSPPPGITLEPTGRLSGTPTIAGSFSFDYSVHDGTGRDATLVGRVDITAPQAVTIPALPEWGTILLGCLLLVAVWRQQRKRAYDRNDK